MSTSSPHRRRAHAMRRRESVCRVTVMSKTRRTDHRRSCVEPLEGRRLLSGFTTVYHQGGFNFPDQSRIAKPMWSDRAFLFAVENRGTLLGGGGELWTTDGTQAGTRLLRSGLGVQATPDERPFPLLSTLNEQRATLRDPHPL